MSSISLQSIGELGNTVRRMPGGPAHHRSRPARNVSISAFGQAVRVELGLLVRRHALTPSPTIRSASRDVRRSPHRMSTAHAGGYGTASAFLAAERGLDLSLTAGAFLAVPRFPAGGRAPDRFELRSSVNTASVEL